MVWMAPAVSILGLLLYIYARMIARMIGTNDEDVKNLIEKLHRVGEIAYFCGLLAFLLTNPLAQKVLFHSIVR